MRTFIGGEYAIAYGLLYQIEHGKDSMTFDELRKFNQRLQNALDCSGVNAYVVGYNLQDTVEKFNKYFQIVELNYIPYVQPRAGIKANDLENRFIGYLPLNVLEIAIETIKG